MSVNTIQVGGDHYKSKGIQPWDFIVTNKLGYLEGNIIKYVSRHTEKGGVTDLLKAKHYLEKLIATCDAAEADAVTCTLTIPDPVAPFGYRKDGVPYKRGPYRKRKTAKKGKA